MPDLTTLTAAVQRNCDIADAGYAQRYSLCTYLLKMREFYRWKCGAALDSPLPREAIGAWLSEREQHWESIEDADYGRIPIGRTTFDPFDTEAINAALVPAGLVYSGGIGRHGQPHFFLADLARVEHHADATVYVAQAEHARDATAPPAMLAGTTIFVRGDALRRLLWQSVEEWRWRRADGPMARLLECYDFARRPQAAIEQMSDHEIAAAVLHERGELAAGQRIGPDWALLLERVAGTPAELVARAVRDHLADTLVTLPALIADADERSLLWWLANLRAMRREIYPQAVAAFAQWVDGAPVSVLEHLCAQGVPHWEGRARGLLELAHAHGEDDGALARAIAATEWSL